MWCAGQGAAFTHGFRPVPSCSQRVVVLAAWEGRLGAVLFCSVISLIRPCGMGFLVRHRPTKQGPGKMDSRNSSKVRFCTTVLEMSLVSYLLLATSLLQESTTILLPVNLLCLLGRSCPSCSSPLPLLFSSRSPPLGIYSKGDGRMLYVKWRAKHVLVTDDFLHPGVLPVREI